MKGLPKVTEELSAEVADVPRTEMWAGTDVLRLVIESCSGFAGGALKLPEATGGMSVCQVSASVGQLRARGRQNAGTQVIVGAKGTRPDRAVSFCRAGRTATSFGLAQMRALCHIG